jgi:Ser/Thr protein kinase RdoA (MazF antagonist)
MVGVTLMDRSGSADVTEVCAAFALGRPRGPVASVSWGELGRVSRLVTTTGVWAIKEIELFVPTVDDADANVELQESMLRAGLSLPRPRRTVDGHGLFRNVRVYQWFDLTALPDGDDDVDAEVAAVLARMHLLAPATQQQPDPWYCDAPSRAEWRTLLEQGAASWWATTIAELVDELTDLPRPDHSPTRICHLDVCPDNVFVSHGRVTVIDWENAGPAATAQDLGSTLWDFFHGDIGRTRAFVDAYRRHGGPSVTLEAALFATARVVQANLIAFHARRTIDPASPAEARRRADQGLRACLARPLTSELVVELVRTPATARTTSPRGTGRHLTGRDDTPPPPPHADREIER